MCELFVDVVNSLLIPFSVESSFYPIQIDLSYPVVLYFVAIEVSIEQCYMRTVI